MNRVISGFDRDDRNDWRAKLDCGHYQHIRHDPPLRIREWVTTADGRASMMGRDLDCRKCDENKPKDF